MILDPDCGFAMSAVAIPSIGCFFSAAHRSPDSRFNPLYIHGCVGVGKTHLLEGIYGRIRRRFPTLQVMYLTSEAFANYFTQALRDHTLPSFRQRFRNVDVLLVDDIDFFDGKRGGAIDSQ